MIVLELLLFAHIMGMFVSTVILVTDVVTDVSDYTCYSYNSTAYVMKPKANILKCARGLWIIITWSVRLTINGLVWLTQVEE